MLLTLKIIGFIAPNDGMYLVGSGIYVIKLSFLY